MFPRLLIVLAVLVAVVVVMRRWRARASARPRTIAARTVRCAHCALYLPRNEAIEVDGRMYCSRQHADRGPR